MRYGLLLAVGLSLPLVTSAADVDAGREKATACMACHGANGVSVSDDIPNLAGQKAAYLSAQLKAFRDGSRKNDLMNAIAAQLQDADIDNLVAFFGSLSTPGESQPSALGETLAEAWITIPEDYKSKFARYSVIEQAGPKRVRYNYANDVAMRGVDAQGNLADGAFILTEIYGAKLDDAGNPVKGSDGQFQPDKLLALAVMEKRAGWGEKVPAELRNGNWGYALFGPDRARRDTNQAKCLACHKPLDKADYLFSYEEIVSKTR